MSAFAVAPELASDHTGHVYDDLAELARALCDAPIALVTLVEENDHRTVAHLGAGSSELITTICSRILTDPDPLVIDDLHQDRRVADLPIRGPQLEHRFFAGVALMDGSEVIGTLCVLDTRTRALSPRQLANLQLLARQVVEQVRLRGGAARVADEFESTRRDLVESRRRWRALVANSPGAIVVVDADATLRYANASAAMLLATTADALHGRSLTTFLPAADSTTVDLVIGTAAGGETVRGHTCELVRDDGETIHVDLYATAVRLEGEQTVQLELRDVTGQQRMLRDTLDSEQRFRALFGAAPVGIAECLPDTTVVDLNAELCRLLGYTRDELVGRLASGLTATADDREKQAVDLASVREGHCYSAVRRLRRRDGSIAHARVSAVALRGADGSVERILFTAIDVTDQVITQETLVAAVAEHERRQAFVDGVLDSIDVGIVACDENGVLTVFNRATQRWHGTGLDGKDDVAGDPEKFGSTFDLFDADMQPLAADAIPLLRALREGSVTGAEMVISPHGLPSTLVRCSGRSISDRSGKPLGAVVAMTDITHDREQQAALLASERLFRAAFDNDPAGMAVVSTSGQVLQANAALAALLGAADGVVAAPDNLAGLQCGDPGAVTDLLELALVQPGTAATAEQLLRLAHRELWVVLTATAVSDPRHEATVLLQVEDITHRKEVEIRLTRQAMYDGLTDLPNRVMLLDRLQTALGRLPRHPDEYCYVLFVDLDGFKEVNDTHGHRAGDHLLRTIAGRLRSTIRPADTVARLGGDEFVVVLERLYHRDEVAVVEHRLRAAVAAPVEWHGYSLQVTASVGSARALPGRDPGELLHEADAAMYEAKRTGKDQDEPPLAATV